MIKNYVSLSSKCLNITKPSILNNTINININNRLFINNNNNNNKIIITNIRNYKTKSNATTTTTTTINKQDNNNDNILKNSNTTPEIQEKIKGLLKLFPPIKYGFAYGSGVIVQKGYNNDNGTIVNDNSGGGDKKTPMIDLIFAVENSKHWHSLNLLNNSSHYSFLSYLGANFITKVQLMSAKIYFNTLLEHNGVRFKYGVIEYNDLIDDLKNWRTLYLSGRMQKPIYNLPNSSQEGLTEIEKINRDYNLKNAVITALLMLPESFTEYDLFHTICKLSYSGDIRMKGAENPMKTHNIVVNNISGFRSLYFPIIENQLSEYLNIITTTTTTTTNNQEQEEEIENDCINLNKFINEIPNSESPIKFKSKQDSMHYINLIMMLPDCVKSPMLREIRSNMKSKKNEKVDTTLIYNTIFMIVSKGSLTQTFKGILTAGFTKSLNYMKLKLISSKRNK